MNDGQSHVALLAKFEVPKSPATLWFQSHLLHLLTTWDHHPSVFYDNVSWENHHF